MVLCDKKTKTTSTLKQVCEKIKINVDNINIDSLNVQVYINKTFIIFIIFSKKSNKADSSLFQRFDRFNNKYNPLGLPELREIFLKNENFIKGRFLAELTKQVPF